MPLLTRCEIETLSNFSDDEILDEMDALKHNQLIHPELESFTLQKMRIFIARRKEFEEEKEKEYGT